MPGVSNLFVTRAEFEGDDQQQSSSPNNDNNNSQIIAPAMPLRADEQSPRFLYWGAFFILTLIVTGSTIETTDKVQASARSITNQKLAVSCAVFSFLTSFAVVLMHLSPISSIIFVSTKLEGGVIFVLMVIWGTLVGVITDASNDLAVNTEGSIIHGNLYFAAWAGLACVAALFFNYFKHVYLFHLNEELSLRSERLNLWVYYTLVAVILLCSAANVYDNECLLTDRKGTMFCGRAVMAMLNSGVGCVCSIIIIGMKFITNIALQRAELIASGLIFMCNAFTLGLVTSENAPGGKSGNIFYFSWISIILSFVLFGASYEYIGKKKDEEKKTKLAKEAAAQTATSAVAATAIASSYNNSIQNGDMGGNFHQQGQQFHNSDPVYYDNNAASASVSTGIEKEYMKGRQGSNRTMNTDSSQTYVSDASSIYSDVPKKDKLGYADSSVGESSYETYPTKDSATQGSYQTKGSGYSTSRGGYSRSHFLGSTASCGTSSYSGGPEKGNYRPTDQFEDEGSSYTEESYNLKKGPQQYEDEGSVWTEEIYSSKKGFSGDGESDSRYSAGADYDDYPKKPSSASGSQYSGSIQKRTPHFV